MTKIKLGDTEYSSVEEFLGGAKEDADWNIKGNNHREILDHISARKPDQLSSFKGN